MLASRVSRAIVVFGYKLDERGNLQDYGRQRLDAAITVCQQRQLPLILSGAHSVKMPVSSRFSEAEVMRRYVEEQPGRRPKMYTDSQATSAPENWLYLRVVFPRLREVTVMTQAPLVPRHEVLREMVYGSSMLKVNYYEIPCAISQFPKEQQRIRKLRCIIEHYLPASFKPGMFELLLDDQQKSRWADIVKAHEDCRRTH